MSEILIDGCLLMQMQHPIQMKPADSEKRGKYSSMCTVCYVICLLVCCVIQFVLVLGIAAM